jgi:hypothetical protein
MLALFPFFKTKNAKENVVECYFTKWINDATIYRSFMVTFSRHFLIKIFKVKDHLLLIKLIFRKKKLCNMQISSWKPQNEATKVAYRHFISVLHNKTSESMSKFCPACWKFRYWYIFEQDYLHSNIDRFSIMFEFYRFGYQLQSR